MKTFLARFARITTVRNALVLYGSQFGTYLLPLVTVPFLARVLGPETWGLILFIQAIGLYVTMVVDYAFDVSATRQVARRQADMTSLTEIVSGVLGARLLLILGSVAALAAAQVLVPTLRDTGWLLWLGVFWYSGVAIRPFWFFLGIERLGAFLTLELSARAVSVVAIILFVHSPADAWKVFAFQGAAAALTAVAGTIMIYRFVPFRAPSLSKTMESLRDGWRLFFLRLSSSVYSMSNTIILGFLASPLVVSFYAGPDRISRILISLMFPLVQAIYPRISNLAQDDAQAAARIARMTTITLFVLGSIGYVVLYFMAPLVIRVMLGPDYGEAVPVLRVLLLLLPILGISIPLGSHWMIPVGLEGLLTRITIAGGVLHIPLAILLGSRFAHVGIASALVITETFILCLIVGVLLARGLGPFTLQLRGRDTKSELYRLESPSDHRHAPS